MSSKGQTSSKDTTLADLPPSSKLIHKILEHEDELTQHQLAEESLLNQRTIRYGIHLLEEEGLIDSRPSLEDGRQSLYSLPGDRDGR
ncbi:MarR family transcriptional regulator [Natronococcus sp. JC468]|uniref:MarR family transcriptional regulator n=1 Tax=Natronococcus sp. JC468 TaxID=1961921 RepID=UPI001439F29A|nr:helix-turn-helix domain-containing protein [Natronococcus sp. JC468]NKE37766.1 MarR family transcriptional regulator [Natronococcus sp. JC468]